MSIRRLLMATTVMMLFAGIAAADTTDAAATYNNIGIVYTFTSAPATSATMTFEYRLASSTGAYLPAPETSRIATNQFAGSILGLQPDTEYTIRISSSAFSTPKLVTIRTKSSNFPVSTTRILHVATNGSDTNTGLSSTTPLRTLAKALSLATAGDEIRLYSGTYNEGDITVTKSGTDIRPITITAAAGASVALDGTNMAFKPSWTSVSAGVYRAPHGGMTPYNAYVNGQHMFRYSTLANLQANGWGITTGAFFRDSTYIYVRFPNNGTPTGNTVTIPKYTTGITFSGASYFQVRNLEIRFYGYGDFHRGIMLLNSSNILVTNCNIHHNGVGVAFKGACNNNTIQNSTFNDSPLSKVSFQGVKDEAPDYEAGAFFFYDSTSKNTGNVIRYNTITDMVDGAHLLPTTAACTASNLDFHDNIIRDCLDDGFETDGYGTNVRIYNNKISNFMTGISIAPACVGPTYIVRNQLWGWNNRDIYPGYPFKTNSGNTGTKFVYVYHNTCYSSNPSQNGFMFKGYSSWDQLIFRNNVFSGTNYALESWAEATYNSKSSFNYDLLWTTDTARFIKWANTTYSTIAAFYSATGNEQNGIKADPKFYNAGGADFTPAIGSPLIDKGVVIAGINQNYGGLAPDIGAIEVGGTTEPPPPVDPPPATNQAPVISDQSFSVAESAPNGTAVGTVAATDPNTGDTLTYAITAGNALNAFAINPATGQITVADTTDLVYATNPSFTLTVKVTDQGGLSDVAYVIISVTQRANTAPGMPNYTFTVDENSPAGTAVGIPKAWDADGDPITYTITSGNELGGFAMNPATGEITVAKPSVLDFETNPVFTIRVKVADSLGAFDTATVTINLNDLVETPPPPAAQAPVVNDQSFTIDENSANGTAVGTVVATDPNAGDTLTYAITAGNSLGAFAIDSAGKITVADSAGLDFETNPSFILTVKVTDQTGLSDTAAVTISLRNVNEGPVAKQVFTIDPNATAGTVVGTVAVYDPDAGDTLRYTIVSGNGDGAFAINQATGSITVANSLVLDFTATSQYKLLVKVTDFAGLVDNVMVIVTSGGTTPPPAPPVVNDQSFTIDENSANGTAVGSVVATGSPTGYAITAGNTAGSFAIDAAGKITVADNTALDYESGTTAFILTVKATNAAGSDTGLVTVLLRNVNEAPVINNQSFSVNSDAANGSLVGTLLAMEPDAGDTLTYAITAGNTAGVYALDAATGKITVANSAAIASAVMTVQVTDKAGLADTASVTISVNTVNVAPVVSDQAFSVNENSPSGTAVGTVAATDANAGDTLTYSITAGNSAGGFAINGTTGQITVATASVLNYESSSAFTLSVKVADKAGLSDTATMVISVKNVNEAPSLANASFTVNSGTANGTLIGTLSAADPDAGEVFTYSITAGNGSGAYALDAATGRITVANSAALASTVLSVKVTDKGGLSATASVTITVNIGNRAPVIANQTFSIFENSAVGTFVGAVVASDPDSGDAITYAITAGNTSTAFAINATTGQITVANKTPLDYETTKAFSLTVKVTDKAGASASATITVNLKDVSENVIIRPR